MNDDNAAERIRLTREREVERATTGRVGRLASSFDTAVVGVTFTPGYPQNLHDLEGLQFEASTAGERLACVIVRNPDNPYDSNACEVHVPALGEQGMVGHLTRPVAQRLAAELDAGQPWQGWVSFIKIHDEHQDRPGLEIHMERSHYG